MSGNIFRHKTVELCVQYASSMFKLSLFTFIIIVSTTTLFAQTKEYKLISKTEKADFNYSSLKFINKTKTREALRNIFNPVKGKHTVYVFTATYKVRLTTTQKKSFMIYSS
jgi:hypothetical protein